ncbi:Transposable element P transposase, partial [Frankliniella fusca]
MNVNLIPGKFCTMIKWLDHKIKQERLPEMARYCILSFDEMTTKVQVEYDKGLKCYSGFVSSEIAKDEDEKLTKASHCLAFVLRGLTTHWKQLLTYLLTGSSVHPGKLWLFLEEMLTLLSKYNFHVLALASDMGGGNQALWKLKGILWSRGQINQSIPHPAPAPFISASCLASSNTSIPAPNPTASAGFMSAPTPSSVTTSIPKLRFTPDTPHLLKNMWAQLLRTIFLLPASFLAKHQLDSNIVSPHHVRE